MDSLRYLIMALLVGAIVFICIGHPRQQRRLAQIESETYSSSFDAVAGKTSPAAVWEAVDEVGTVEDVEDVEEVGADG